MIFTDIISAVTASLDPADYMYSYYEPHTYMVIGFHRSGTNWLRRMLLDVLGKFDLSRYVPSELGHVGALHWHLRAPVGGGKVVFSVRDPRDIIVSMMKMFPNFNTIYDAMLDAPEERIHPPFFPSPIHTIEAINQEFQYWLVDDEPDCITSYERLYGDTPTELARICDQLEIQPFNDPATVAARHTVQITAEVFKHTNGDQTSHSVVSGYGTGLWQRKMNQEQGKFIDDILGHWLISLGYETDKDWWHRLPVS